MSDSVVSVRLEIEGMMMNVVSGYSLQLDVGWSW